LQSCRASLGVDPGCAGRQDAGLALSAEHYATGLDIAKAGGHEFPQLPLLSRPSYSRPIEALRARATGRPAETHQLIIIN
jgi:hypothetical protein